jgi:hypothetical protein
MRLPQDIRLPELMGLIGDIAPEVHIRLALTPDSIASTPPPSNADWIARSLVVDVYPTVWLSRKHEGPLAEHPPLLDLLDFPNRALLYAGFRPTESIVRWFGNPADCKLTGFDWRPGHASETRRFHLPESQDTAHQYHVFSGLVDGFTRLPWPHHNFEFNLKGSNYYRPGDQNSLFIPGHHYDDFRDARGRFIYDLTDLRTYQDRDQIMIRVVDADGWIPSVHLRGRKLKVEIAGRKVYPPAQAQVFLKGTGLRDDPDTRRDILGTGFVDFTLKADPPPDLRVVLANEESGDLDQARRQQFSGPLDISSPHFIEEEDEPNTAQAPPASDGGADDSTALKGEQPKVIVGPPRMIATQTGVNGYSADASTAQKAEQRSKVKQNRRRPAVRRIAKRELRVVVVSPGDVKRERECLPTVLAELNEGIAGELGLHLSPWLWETDSYPGFHVQGPQGQIDDQMRIQDADIVVGIFWTRIGTPLSDGKTGTEHELLRAYEVWQQQHRPHILVYFSQARYAPKSRPEAEQLSALWAFRDELKPKGLLGTYASAARFPDTLRLALTRLLMQEYKQAR